MFKIRDLQGAFLNLVKEDAVKVLSHSYLNMDSELDVAMMAINWIKENDQANNDALEILKQVRWATLSTFEKRHIVNDVLNKNEILKKLIINLTKELTNKDPRGWPQLLLLAETLDASRTVFDNLKLIQELSIHSYDPETKRWSVLGKQKSCSGSKTGTISVARVQHDTLVFTSAKSSREKMIYNKMPFNISVYNFWTDSW